jgi:hypothetical protein
VVDRAFDSGSRIPSRCVSRRHGKRARVFPLSQADDAPPTTVVDALDVVIESAIPYDDLFFEYVNRIVQAEPWLTTKMA